MTTERFSEFEATMTFNDGLGVWAVFTDSKRLSGKLKKVAAAWGVEVKRLGAGVEFDLPLRAIRFAKPPSERRRASGRALAQKAKSKPGGGRLSVRRRGPTPQTEGEAIPPVGRV